MNYKMNRTDFIVIGVIIGIISAFIYEDYYSPAKVIGRENQAFIAAIDKRQKDEKALEEMQVIVAEQQRFRRAAARKYFGNGNPEHLDLLADTLTEEQLDLYRRYINRK
jgi:hypothetical protein